MHKTPILILLLLAGLGLLEGLRPQAPAAAGAPGRATGCEVRGTWLNPPAFDSPTARAATFASIQTAKINTVFMLAPPVAGFRGWSDPADFGAMLTLLDEAGVSVHIWSAVMYRVLGQEADFRDLTEQAAQVAWADALLRAYPQADGYHLDYIRYSGILPVNDGGRLEGVSQTVAAIAAHLAAHFPSKHLTAAVFRVSAYAADFDTEDIPQWFLDWYSAHPGNPYDHPPYWETTTVPFNFKKQQDPVSWMRETSIRGVMPMEYDTLDSWWQAEVDHWGLFMGDQGLDMERIWMGVGWYEDYDAPGVVRKIKYGRAQGMGGVVIFELGNPDADDSVLVNALAVDGPDNEWDAPYAAWAPSCLRAASVYLPLVFSD
jgi:hypothetical protein